MSTSAEAPTALAGASSGALGAIAFRGPDAGKFLQGQLSAEIEKLAAGARTLAGLHNPQGRVIALLAVTRQSSEEFLAVLPLELLAAVMGRLNKYVLRAKVRLADVTAESAILPAWGPDHELAEIRAGIPQVYTATSETFVAQMLNLDLLGAIAFDKGCYTGQEVIARAHYRGRVKRRLQRWQVHGDAPKPGDTVHAADGRTLTVVRCAPSPEGHELLAVGTFGITEAPAPDATAANLVGIEVQGPLPLPYALPS
jgi:folate-binding protein YgfZ